MSKTICAPKHLCKQNAVYWPEPRDAEGKTARTVDGRLKLGSGSNTGDGAKMVARAVKVRWQNEQKLFVDSKGKEARSRAIIYMVEEVDDEGFLLLNDKADGTHIYDLVAGVDGKPTLVNAASVPDPRNLGNAFRIRARAKTTSPDGCKIVYKVWL